MLLTLAVTYLLAGAALTIFQRRLIYFPTRATRQALDQVAAVQRLEPWTNASGETVGWKRISQNQPTEASVLVLHGNAGCAVDRAYLADTLQKTAPLDVYILEYPGYGAREGSPTEATFCAAAEDAWRALGDRGRVYLVGESLGTGVAAYLAGKHPERIDGLLLMAPYDSLASPGQARMRIFPVRWMLLDRFPSDQHLKVYRGPVAFVLAELDVVVPAKFGRRLYESYAGPKRLWELPGAGHNDVQDQPQTFWKELLEFWNEHRVGKSDAG